MGMLTNLKKQLGESIGWKIYLQWCTNGQASTMREWLMPST
jgi:hypothetical protein